MRKNLLGTVNTASEKVFKPFKHENVVDTSSLLLNRGDRVTHGDVIIIKCDKSDFPANFNSLADAPLGVLAEGEHSQHAHQLFYDDVPAVNVKKAKLSLIKTDGRANLFGEDGNLNVAGSYELKMVSNSEMYLEVKDGPVMLKHQEHNPYKLMPGYYEVGFQEEFDHLSKLRRQVID